MNAFESFIGRLPKWVPPIVIGLFLAFVIPLVILCRQTMEMRSHLTSLGKAHEATTDELAVVRIRISALELELRKEREATENEREFLRKQSARLESELLEAKRGISILNQRRIPSKEVSSSLVAIGVEWNDSPSNRSHVWCGTGFGVRDSELFATAAHVVQEVQDLQSSFEKKGVPSRIVIRYPDAAISSLTRAKLHPKFNRNNRNTDEPSCDIAVFVVEPSRPVARLQLAEAMSPEIGDEIFVAGFPQSVPQIRYPSRLEEPFVPTVRCGRVERLIDVDDLAKSSQRNLLQLDVPLVGGFSGSPVVNFSGKVVGIAIFATHRHLKESLANGSQTSHGSTTRILDAAHVSFAVSATLLKGMLEEINRESIPNGLEAATDK